MDFILNFEDEDQLSQDRLLKNEIPYYRNYQGFSSPKGLSAYNVKTIIDSKGNYINEIRVENNSEEEDMLLASNSVNESHPKHLVMIHGYGASCGWFYKNLHGLICANPNSKIHALDLLGFGLSSRPEIKYEHDTSSEANLDIIYDQSEVVKNIPKTSNEKKRKNKKTFATPKHFKVRSQDVLKYIKNQRDLVDEVEGTYVDSLEKWRLNNGIEKFDLLGHSLGGYLAVAYCLKYPNHVKRLVLVSPGGVERSPFSVTNPRYLALQKLSEDRTDTIPEYLESVTSHWPGDYSFLGRYTSVKESFKLIWQTRTSFFAMLRWMGPLGPKKLSERNISRLTRSGYFNDWKEIDLFIKYIYNTGLKSSFSETSIMRIFDASVVAKYPLLDRIDKLQVPKSLWIYGEHDFMFTDCGHAAVNKLNSKPGFEAKFDLVSNAGHNLYLDNYKEFNQKVLRFLGWHEAR
ncbi:hypothetical protein FOA43_000369 [Brettanomyces nanus]|uniref:AB hydrolase-1 domain-containing protein n=1 Tax=Eeniella nana TaxID=13502 RepID=A0A875RYD6_EENNA|nr:uncharacterized protein FOA43_000369 [Brettanomyces nanus]QPG73065.1 hypothetical protein FOA43_000369 [Brettanomyces nanus]